MTPEQKYLNRLQAELRGLPRTLRKDILTEVGEHIDTARSEPDPPDIATVLHRLGDPAEIAAEARERFGVQPRRPGAWEVIVLAATASGPLIALTPYMVLDASTA